MAEVFTSLLLIVAVAFVAPLISWTIPKRLVPEVVLLILGGMLIGPHGLGLAVDDSSIELLRELGVAFLFLMAGYEIDINELRGAGGRHAAVAWLLSLGLAFGAVSVIGVTGGAASANGIAIATAMTSTAIGTILPILRDRGLLPTAVGASILNHGAVGEVGPVIVMALLLGSRSTWASMVILGVFLIITLLIVRFTSRVKRVGRRLVEAIHLGASTTAQTTIRATVLLLVGLCAIAAIFDLDVILGAFAAGFVLRHALPEGDAEFEEKLDGLAYGFFIPIFFVTSGMGIEAGLDAGDLVNLLAFFVLLVLVRGVPVWLASRAERRRDGSRIYSMRQSLQIAVYSTTALPIIVAVTQVAVSAGAMSTSFASTLVLAGVLSVLVLPAAGLALGHRSDHAPANEVMRVVQGPAAPDGRIPEEATAPVGEQVSEPRRPASPPVASGCRRGSAPRRQEWGGRRSPTWWACPTCASRRHRRWHAWPSWGCTPGGCRWRSRTAWPRAWPRSSRITPCGASAGTTCAGAAAPPGRPDVVGPAASDSPGPALVTVPVLSPSLSSSLLSVVVSVLPPTGTSHAAGDVPLQPGTSRAFGDGIPVPDGVECPRPEGHAPGRILRGAAQANGWCPRLCGMSPMGPEWGRWCAESRPRSARRSRRNAPGGDDGHRHGLHGPLHRTPHGALPRELLDPALELSAAETGLLLRQDGRCDTKRLQDRQQGDIGGGRRLHPAQGGVDACTQLPLGEGIERGVTGVQRTEQPAGVDAHHPGRRQGLGDVAGGVELAPAHQGGESLAVLGGQDLQGPVQDGVPGRLGADDVDAGAALLGQADAAGQQQVGEQCPGEPVGRVRHAALRLA